MDVWTRPYPIFGQDEPATIHLAGQKLKEERLSSQFVDAAKWRQKVIVEDTDMTFHRCAPATEMKLAGIQASNQLARLQGRLVAGQGNGYYQISNIRHKKNHKI